MNCMIVKLKRKDIQGRLLEICQLVGCKFAYVTFNNVYLYNPESYNCDVIIRNELNPYIINFYDCVDDDILKFFIKKQKKHIKQTIHDIGRRYSIDVKKNSLRKIKKMLIKHHKVDWHLYDEETKFGIFIVNKNNNEWKSDSVLITDDEDYIKNLL